MAAPLMNISQNAPNYRKWEIDSRVLNDPAAKYTAQHFCIIDLEVTEHIASLFRL